MFRTSILNAVADIEYHQPIAPVSEIGQAIFDLQVMQIPPDNFTSPPAMVIVVATWLDFPPRHFFDASLGEIDDAH